MVGVVSGHMSFMVRLTYTLINMRILQNPDIEKSHR